MGAFSQVLLGYIPRFGIASKNQADKIFLIWTKFSSQNKKQKGFQKIPDLQIYYMRTK